jgi:hypothetical protein
MRSHNREESTKTLLKWYCGIFSAFASIERTGDRRLYQKMKLNPGFRRLMLLAPPHARIPGSFSSVAYDRDRHRDLLRQVQELRGAIYLEDGAIDKTRLTRGRHVAESDHVSWHLLVLDSNGGVCGCTRYRHHPSDVDFAGLSAADSALASCPVWGETVRCAVQEELMLSRTLDLPFVEVGGWAIAEEIRNTVEALRMVLASYAFFRTFGGAVGLATATVRHSSASILRRIGGHSLQFNGQQVPSYLDRQYNCSMEMLRFYSWAPNPRFDPWIREIACEIQTIPVVSGQYLSETMPEPAWFNAEVTILSRQNPGGHTPRRPERHYPSPSAMPAGILSETIHLAR